MNTCYSETEFCVRPTVDGQHEWRSERVMDESSQRQAALLSSRSGLAMGRRRPGMKIRNIGKLTSV